MLKQTPDSTKGQALLGIQFIIQSVPDIRGKLQTAAMGPQIPLSQLLSTAFKVYNNRDREEKVKKKKNKRDIAQMHNC